MIRGHIRATIQQSPDYSYPICRGYRCNLHWDGAYSDWICEINEVDVGVLGPGESGIAFLSFTFWELAKEFAVVGSSFMYRQASHVVATGEVLELLES